MIITIVFILGVLVLCLLFAGAIYVADRYARTHRSGEFKKAKKRVYLIFGGVLFLTCQLIILCNRSSFIDTSMFVPLLGGWVLVCFDIIVLSALVFSTAFCFLKRNINPFILLAVSVFLPILVCGVNFALFSGPLQFLTV